jgi:DNA integrity scanning protein DisA with diadenylate cyclase activity
MFTTNAGVEAFNNAAMDLRVVQVSEHFISFQFLIYFCSSLAVRELSWLLQRQTACIVSIVFLRFQQSRRMSAHIYAKF